mgnify:CR=1 FL=1|jgi:hypothetical protein
MNYNKNQNMSWRLPRRKISKQALINSPLLRLFKNLMGHSFVVNFQAGFRQGRAERQLNRP